MYIVRGAIVAFWLAAVAFAVYVYIKNPIENNVYGFLIHARGIFAYAVRYRLGILLSRIFHRYFACMGVHSRLLNGKLMGR